MAQCKDPQDGDRFRVRPAAPESRSGPRVQRFVTQALKAASKAGASSSGAFGSRPASTFGRGRLAAGMAGARLAANARRVVIKARFVVLRKGGASSVATHLRYIERDGVTRDGQPGQAYGALTDAADLKAFEERGKGDRHQFRFIVSVEDAEQLEDLRGYTRELMRRMAVDLETGLDWVAVDHWDTDNPHTHVVLRGRGGGGRTSQDLVIAPDYMAHGMRMRACEIATEWLGPRTELEIRQGLLREVEQERLTSIDRMLLRQAEVGVVDLSKMAGNRQRQNMLHARLQRLGVIRLAVRIDANHWRLASHMAQSLTTMGERGDILRAVHRAMKGEQRVLSIEVNPTAPIIGRIAGKGLADDLHSRSYLVIDGVDGRAHYLTLPTGADWAALPVGGIVEAKPVEQERAVDRSIAAVAKGGIYKTAEHIVQLTYTNDRSPQSTVDVHVRRLEALRRAGLVERMADGNWHVPSDLMEKAREYDLRKAAPVIRLRSHLPIEQQVRAIGATWLDRQLIGEGRGLAAQGFGARVVDAMRGRADFLVEQGLAERAGARLVLARDLLSTLRDRELAAVGQSLQDQTGKIYLPLRDGGRASGLYRRSIQLASGRFAMLDDGMGFRLVLWRPAIEQRLGQHITAVVRGQSVTWQSGRHQGMSI